MSEFLTTAVTGPLDEVTALVPAIAPAESDFQGEGFRELGIQYQVTGDNITGFDPERPELGRMTVPITSTLREAKLILMWNLCAGLSPDQQARRVHLKPL